MDTTAITKTFSLAMVQYQHNDRILYGFFTHHEKTHTIQVITKQIQKFVKLKKNSLFK